MTSRFNALSSILHTNPKAKFVTRVVQMGSEPLFDSVITPAALTTQVLNAKKALSDIGISVTVSDMAYGYQVRNSTGSQGVLDAIDSINAHMLPFFAKDATTGEYHVPGITLSPFRLTNAPSANNSWPDVMSDLQYFIDHGGGKKIYLSEVRQIFLPTFVRKSRLIDPLIPIVERLAIYRCGDFEYKTPKPRRSRQRQQ